MFAMRIDGRPVAVPDGYDVHDPATGEIVGRCPIGGRAEVDAAVAAARAAFAGWSMAPDADRAAACLAIADAIDAHAEELATLLTREQGKPLNGAGSRFEVGGCAAWARHTAGLTIPVETIQDDEAARIAVHRAPLGVVASITPWNWPLLIAMWHLAPAVRTGCTIVLKPSPYTPLATLRMIEIIDAVLPPGVVNIVAGTDDLGPMLTGHDDVAKVVFTGSTATGRKVMESAAGTLKRLTLELGGNDAGIVLTDANPAAVAEEIFWSAFINGGQTCAALKRLYVPDALYDDLCAALAGIAASVPMGNGLDEASALGPIQNAAQFAKVRDLVDRAVAAGARALTGGRPGEGLFYPATILADARDGMAVVDEEQFGPVLPVIRYTDLEAAITAANALDLGLGASVWSSDPARARAVAARLQSGTCWINKHGVVRPDTPFGGVKASGLGVEFGLHGLLEYTSIHVVHE